MSNSKKMDYTLERLGRGSNVRAEGRRSMIEHSSVFFVFSKSEAIFQKVKKNTGSLVAGLVSSMVRSKVRVEGSLRPMGSSVAGQIRSTSTLNPHTPEVEGRG